MKMKTTDKIAYFNLLLVVLACLFTAGYYLGLSNSTVTHEVKHTWKTYIEMLPNVETYKPETAIPLSIEEWIENAPKTEL